MATKFILVIVVIIGSLALMGCTLVGSTPVGNTLVGNTLVGSTLVGSTLVGNTLVGSTLALAAGPNFEQRILDASIMITITVPVIEEAAEAEKGLPIPADEYRAIARPTSYIAAEGLGTLVTSDGELSIVTHDHWSGFESQLGNVQITDGRGQSLDELPLHQFKELVHFRDGGTMVVSAPKVMLARLQPAQFSQLSRSPDSHQLSAGDTVDLVYRQRDGKPGLAVIQAEVESTGQKQGLPVVRLNISGGLPIVGGDSGGGLWLDGQLVANTWTTILTVDGETGETRQSDSSIAALLTSASGEKEIRP